MDDVDVYTPPEMRINSLHITRNLAMAKHENLDSHWYRSDAKYLPQQANRLDATDKFSGVQNPPAVADFWQWAYSDLRDNAIRGVLGEFIVATALGIELSTRQSWDPRDLTTSSGIRLEIKTSAFLQNWPQQKQSSIVFGGLKARSWASEKGRYSDEADYHADVYVFCVQRSRNHAEYNVLDFNQWEFYVVPVFALQDYGGKTITEAKVIGMGFKPCSYSELGQNLAVSAPLESLLATRV